MNRRPVSISALLACAVFGLLLPRVGAVTLDWDTVSWTAGSLSQSFNIDGVAGNDVTITISGNTGNFDGTAPANVPYGANTFGTGLSSVDGGTGQSNLNTRTDWTNNTSVLTFTITFIGKYANGVHLDHLSIYDIDRTSPAGTTWIDKIYNIYGTAPNNSLVAPSNVVSSKDNQVTGSGTNFVLTGTTNAANNVPDANGYIYFSGTSVIKSVTFTWGNAAGTDANPASQIIALGDFTFTSAPEVGSSLAALLLCGGLAGSRPFRRRRS